MKVVNLRKEKCTHYIGRGSIFGNPFVIGKEGTREEVIRQYEQCIRDMLEDRKDCFCPFRKAVYNLPENAILGCYCKPKACHGDIIIKIWEELHK